MAKVIQHSTGMSGFINRFKVGIKLKAPHGVKLSQGETAAAGPAIIIGLLIGLIAAELVKPAPQPANASQQSSECPVGSYNIGESKTDEPLCKLEPTGCPYGDSIPMDMCDKFAPQAEQPQQENIIPAQPQKAAQCGGN